MEQAADRERWAGGRGLGRRGRRRDGPGRESSRGWWALIAICSGTFMLLVDVTIVQVALPRIQRDLHASFTSLQWVIDAYALTLSALILTSGTLADRVGRKRVFIGGVAIFTLASLLCGLSESMTLLIFARALQGFGGAAMFATSLALVAQEFRGPRAGERDRRVERDRRRRRRGGPADRGRAHRRARLAVDLLREHPDRDRHDRDLADAHGQRARPRRRAAGLGRPRSRSRARCSC